MEANFLFDEKDTVECFRTPQHVFVDVGVIRLVFPIGIEDKIVNALKCTEQVKVNGRRLDT